MMQSTSFSSPANKKRLKNIDYSEFKIGLKQLSKLYPNIHFYDFSNTIKERNLFYYANHFNYNVAIKFSETLRDSIQN